MKNSIKLLILAGMLQGALVNGSVYQGQGNPYNYDLGVATRTRVGAGAGAGTNNQGQSLQFGQDTLLRVNGSLQSFEQQATGVRDVKAAKALLRGTLGNLNLQTGEDFSDLEYVTNNITDIIDEDTQSDPSKFNEAFKIFAKGFHMAIIVPLRTVVGVAGGAAAGAVVGVAGIVHATSKALYSTVTGPAPVGQFKRGDSLGTMAVKLLPNILSRALNVVLTPSAVAAISTIATPVLVVGGAAIAGAAVNMNSEQRGKVFDAMKESYQKQNGELPNLGSSFYNQSENPRSFYTTRRSNFGV